jgi:hypothetical protein
MKKLETVVLVTCLLVLFERDACGYTDPGTGALVWQMVGAAFVGGMFHFRRFWHTVTGWWRKDEKR